ncbi:hypothetical protein FRC12_002019 [Ceratobasidium sp. 428]|nr:hypothetical protein FRC12_002019 [Ceratobasidium sp. 428]
MVIRYMPGAGIGHIGSAEYQGAGMAEPMMIDKDEPEVTPPTSEGPEESSEHDGSDDNSAVTTSSVCEEDQDS